MCLSAAISSMAADRLDSLFQWMEKNPVQEKVYLHLDNNCYFKGDTIWYKAYVVRADDLKYTDMSHILYVELVTPDGMMVERQQLIVSDKGYSCGNFALPDTLYSGFYELRAYTRWMLNFKVTSHPFWKDDIIQFYNPMMAADFFRQYGTIYSRVVPVYEAPLEQGGFNKGKYIVERPKQEKEKALKEKLNVKFYAEGGHLIEGTNCRVAYEATDEEGEFVDVKGVLNGTPISTEYQGRGLVDLNVNSKERLKATFYYNNKEYTFKLPEVELGGCALRLDVGDDAVDVSATLRQLPDDRHFGAIVLCRGILRWHQALSPDVSGKAVFRINKKELPTGVCDLIIIDDRGAPLADRLFFVNNHDYDDNTIKVSGSKLDYEPYEMISLDFQVPDSTDVISISVRDRGTDDPTYDTGNIMSDLLLSSELRGFIPYPDYYFESDDDAHRRALDLLMMVQGWRRYDYMEIMLTDSLRYTPETHMTVEGGVFNAIYFDEHDFSRHEEWANEFMNFASFTGGEEDDAESMSPIRSEMSEISRMDRFTSAMDVNNIAFNRNNNTNTSSERGHSSLVASNLARSEAMQSNYKRYYSGLKKEVKLDAELIINKTGYDVSLVTNNHGRYLINLPPFYGNGILMMMAYDTNKAEEKVKKLKMKGRLDEEEYPEYYVKRDLFYPVFAKKYSFYQCHLPEETFDFVDNDDIDLGRKLSNMDRTLDTLVVKGKKRRGRIGINYLRPQCSYDAVELYNRATDYGLSFGKFDSHLFSNQVVMSLLGNMNTRRYVSRKVLINYYTRYLMGMKKYMTEEEKDSVTLLRLRSTDTLFGDLELHLKRLKRVNIFTDFDLRNEDKPFYFPDIDPDSPSGVSETGITIDYVTMLDDAVRPTFRDRWIVIQGMYLPDDFYHPDYTDRKPETIQGDYRRTLYWNPNAKPDQEGVYKARFYNNGKNTRIKVSTVGITQKGIPIYNK